MLRPEPAAVHTNALTLALWLAGPVLQLAIVVAMLGRRLHRRVPIFFSYVLFHLLSFPVLFVLSKHSYPAYVYGYWGREAVGFLLGLFVVYEVFAEVFLSYRGVLRLGLAIFQWAAVVSLLVAVLAAMVSPGAETDRVLAGGLVLSRTVRIVQVSLMLLTVLLAAHTRVPWPHHVFGIAMGFGMYIAVDLVTLHVRSEAGGLFDGVLSVIRPASYLLALVVWGAFMVIPEPAPKSTEVEAAQIAAWDKSLQELL